MKIKVEVIKEFTLQTFNELENIVRSDYRNNESGRLYVGDTFDCNDGMVEYLTGKNPNGDVVIKVIEVEPKKTIDEEKIVKKVFEENKPIKKKASKK